VKVNTPFESIKAFFSGKAAPEEQQSLGLVLGSFFKACKANGEYPVIFIDEANKAFKAAEGDETAQKHEVNVLDLVTRISKRQREASVVLATSEHGPTLPPVRAGLQHRPH
jgi:hypothetical protein